jgi:membrane protein implicated in regulation of membrane protease activity
MTLRIVSEEGEEQKMGRAGPPTPESAATPQSPQPTTHVGRQATIKSWSVFVFLWLSFVAAVVALAAPLFWNSLPGVWAVFAQQPLWLCLVLIFWLLVMLYLIWRWWRASKTAEAALQQEEKKAQVAEQRGVLVEVTSEQTEQLSKEIRAASEQVTTTIQEEISKFVQQQAEEKTASIPSRIVALADMPRVASLVGRDELLKKLLERLRASDTMGIFALSGIGGVGKTALASAAVEQLAIDETSFPGGVAWIGCKDLRGEAGCSSAWWMPYGWSR